MKIAKFNEYRLNESNKSIDDLSYDVDYEINKILQIDKFRDELMNNLKDTFTELYEEYGNKHGIHLSRVDIWFGLDYRDIFRRIRKFLRVIKDPKEVLKEYNFLTIEDLKKFIIEHDIDPFEKIDDTNFIISRHIRNFDNFVIDFYEGEMVDYLVKKRPTMADSIKQMREIYLKKEKKRIDRWD